MFKCGICEREYDDALLNLHHRIPRNFGGDDSKGNLFNLCSSCHQTLHRLAEHYLNPHKTGLINGIAQNYCRDFSNPQVSCNKLKDFAKCAYEYELKVSTGQLKLNPWSEKMLMVQVPLRVKELFEQSCKRKIVFGKKGTMTSVLLDYIFKTVMKEFPNEAKNIQPLITARLKTKRGISNLQKKK